MLIPDLNADFRMMSCGNDFGGMKPLPLLDVPGGKHNAHAAVWTFGEVVLDAFAAKGVVNGVTLFVTFRIRFDDPVPAVSEDHAKIPALILQRVVFAKV